MLPAAPPCAAARTDAAATDRANSASGRERPIAPTLRAAVHDGYTALWLGPDEYLVFGDRRRRRSRRIRSSTYRIERSAFSLEGPRAAWCLNAFCPLDLDDVPEGVCTRTIVRQSGNHPLAYRRSRTSISRRRGHSLPMSGLARGSPPGIPSASGSVLNTDRSITKWRKTWISKARSP